MTSKTKKIDHLTEDELIPNQLWVCLSFVSPEGIKNCNIRGLKIRGVFADRKDADKRANELQKIDPDFHVFVGEVGKWLPWDPDPNSVEDSVYAEDQLNDLVKGYKDNLSKTKEMERQRKEDMIKQAATDEQSKNRNDKLEKRKARMRRKLEARKQQKDNAEKEMNEETNTQSMEIMESEIKTEEERVKSEKENVKEVSQLINEKEKNLSLLDDKLSKIQTLYESNKEKFEQQD